MPHLTPGGPAEDLERFAAYLLRYTVWRPPEGPGTDPPERPRH